MPQPSAPRPARPGRRHPGLWVGLVGGGTLLVVVGLAVAISLLVGGLVSPAEPVVRVRPPPAEPITPAPTAGTPDPTPAAPTGSPGTRPSPGVGPTGGASEGPTAAGPTRGPGAPATPRAGTESAAPPAGDAPPFPTEPSPRTRSTGSDLADNRLYDVTGRPGSLGCEDPPLPEPGVPDEELQELATEIVACLTQTMAPLLAEQDLVLTAPSVATFDADVDTPCGAVTVQRYPAYYCSFDTTIYLNELTDDTAINYAEVTRGYWLVLAHEFGHHLQQVSGMFPRYTRLWVEAGEQERHELTRRLELQATCFAGVQLNLMWRSLELDAGTTAELERYAATTNDEVTAGLDHGDAESMRSWLMAGYLRGWGSLGHCRTWTAPADDVS